MTGIQASIGPPWPMPRLSANRPHWKIATTMPNEAAAASRFIAAAVSGMTMLRNAMSSSRNDQPDDDGDEQRQLPGEDVREVDVGSRSSPYT